MRKFCLDIVRATVESREKHGTVKKDLMQSMIQLRNNNCIEYSDEFKLDSNGMNIMSHQINQELHLNFSFSCSSQIDEFRANCSTSIHILRCWH